MCFVVTQDSSRGCLQRERVVERVLMKTTCPHCNTDHNVPDKDVLEYIERAPKLRTKVAALLGRLSGGQTKLDAEGRRARALKAVQAREAKRNAFK